MNSRQKAVLNKDKAVRLKRAWNVDAEQVRYSDDGHWYATLARFPAALFDARGYIRFATEVDYRAAPMSIGKQISVPKPGISAMPGYVRMPGFAALDDPHWEGNRFSTQADIEGTMTEVLRFQRKRSRALRDAAFGQSGGICRVCDVDFSKLLGGRGVRVLQVHHRKQLSSRKVPSVTTVADLAVVCANCHMLLHLDPDVTLSVEELRDILREDESRSIGRSHPRLAAAIMASHPARDCILGGATNRPVVFADVLEAAEHLDADAQAELVEVLIRHRAERGRERAAASVEEARQAFAEGACRPTTAAELIRETTS